MVSQNKRREKDVMKLLVSQFDVHLPNDSVTSEFIVKFNGPTDSPYEGVSIIRLAQVIALLKTRHEIAVRMSFSRTKRPI